MSRFCPKNALYCPGRKPGKSIAQRGTVNGQEVGNIVLDTGCSQTMVHSRLIPPDKLLEEEGVVVRCVHSVIPTNQRHHFAGQVECRQRFHWFHSP